MQVIQDSSIQTFAYRDLPPSEHESPFDPHKRFEQATGKWRPKVEHLNTAPYGDTARERASISASGHAWNFSYRARWCPQGSER